ncbi:MAG: AI-2E family transporter, partial [Pseudomonadota bacterium]
MDRTLFITLMSYTVTVLFLYLLFTILSPFLAVLVWAGAIGTITFPLYARVLVSCRGREIRAAVLMTAAVVLSVIVPLVGLLFSLSREAALAYHYLERFSSETTGLGMADILNHPLVTPWLAKLRPLIGTLDIDMEAMVLPTVKNGLAGMLNYSTGIVKNFFSFMFKLVLMLITLFFIYKDGTSFLHRFWQAIAINESLRTTIVATVTRVLGAVMYGVILTCMVQGTLGGLGFWAAGLPSPFLFGTLMAICAPIPFIGTALIWIPGAIYLL